MTYSLHYGQTFSQFSAPAEPAVQLLSLQCRLIKELAAKGDSVFVGRAADVVLEEYTPFKLFVYADEASKLVRCRERAPEGENLSDRELLRQMKRIDKARAEYHDIIAVESVAFRQALTNALIREYQKKDQDRDDAELPEEWQ